MPWFNTGDSRFYKSIFGSLYPDFVRSLLGRSCSVALCDTSLLFGKYQCSSVQILFLSRTEYTQHMFTIYLFNHRQRQSMANLPFPLSTLD